MEKNGIFNKRGVPSIRNSTVNVELFMSRKNNSHKHKSCVIPLFMKSQLWLQVITWVRLVLSFLCSFSWCLHSSQMDISRTDLPPTDFSRRAVRRRKFPERTIPRTNIFTTGNSPNYISSNGHFTERTFPQIIYLISGIKKRLKWTMQI